MVSAIGEKIEQVVSGIRSAKAVISILEWDGQICCDKKDLNCDIMKGFFMTTLE